MNLQQTTGIDHSAPSAKEHAGAPAVDRCLSLTVEGAALNMPEIDADAYKAFRANVKEKAMQMPDRLPAADKLAQIQKIVHEFENYKKGVESALKDRQNGWRALTSTVVQELLSRVGVDAGSSDAAPLVSKIAGLATGEEIQAYRDQLREFLHPSDGGGSADEGASPLKVADRSTANHNAAGLRGGGAAVEHLKSILGRRGRGFVVIFTLSCLDVISERFGMEAVEDCLMAVSAFLIASLRRDDVIYHWSDSSLLAIMEGRANEQILTAELQRISNRNREITIQMGGRMVMLRVPLDFEITPTGRFRTAEDLYKLSMEPATQWRNR